MNEFEALVARIEASLRGLIAVAGEAETKLDGVLDVEQSNGRLSAELKSSSEALEKFVKALRFAASDSKTTGFARLETGIKRINDLTKSLDTTSLSALNKVLGKQLELMQRIAAMSESQKSVVTNMVQATAAAAREVNSILVTFKDVNQQIGNMAVEIEASVKSFNFKTALGQVEGIQAAVNNLDISNYDKLIKKVELLAEKIREIPGVNTGAPIVSTAPKSTTGTRNEAARQNLANVPTPEVDMSKVLANVYVQLKSVGIEVEKGLKAIDGDTLETLAERVGDNLKRGLATVRADLIASGKSAEAVEKELKAAYEQLSPESLVSTIAKAFTSGDTGRIDRIVKTYGKEITSAVAVAFKSILSQDQFAQVTRAITSRGRGRPNGNEQKSIAELELESLAPVAEPKRARAASRSTALTTQTVQATPEQLRSKLAKLESQIDKDFDAISDILDATRDVRERITRAFLESGDNRKQDKLFGSLREPNGEGLEKSIRKSLSNTTATFTAAAYNSKESQQRPVSLNDSDAFSISAQVERITQRIVDLYSKAVKEQTAGNIEGASTMMAAIRTELVDNTGLEPSEIEGVIAQIGSLGKLLNADAKLTDRVNARADASRDLGRITGGSGGLSAQRSDVGTQAIEGVANNIGRASTPFAPLNSFIESVSAGLKDIAKIPASVMSASEKLSAASMYLQNSLGNLNAIVDSNIIKPLSELGDRLQDTINDLRAKITASIDLFNFVNQNGEVLKTAGNAAGYGGEDLKFFIEKLTGLLRTDYEDAPVVRAEENASYTKGSVQQGHRDVLYADTRDLEASERVAVNLDLLRTAISKSETGVAYLAGGGQPHLGSEEFEVTPGIKLALDHAMLAFVDKLTGQIKLLELKSGYDNTVGGNTFDLDMLASRSGHTADLSSMADHYKVMAAAPVKGLSEASASDLVAEVAAVQQPGAVYAMASAIGETCSSSIAAGFRNSGLDSSVGKPVAGVNVVTPAALMRYVLGKNEDPTTYKQNPISREYLETQRSQDVSRLADLEQALSVAVTKTLGPDVSADDVKAIRRGESLSDLSKDFKVQADLYGADDASHLSPDMLNSFDATAAAFKRRIASIDETLRGENVSAQKSKPVDDALRTQSTNLLSTGAGGPLGALTQGLGDAWRKLADLPSSVMGFADKLKLASQQAVDTLGQASQDLTGGNFTKMFEDFRLNIVRALSSLQEAGKKAIAISEAFAEDAQRADRAMRRSTGDAYAQDIVALVGEIVKGQIGLGTVTSAPASNNPADWGAADTSYIREEKNRGKFVADTRSEALSPEQRAAINYALVQKTLDASEHGIGLFNSTTEKGQKLGHSFAAYRDQEGETRLRHYYGSDKGSIGHDEQDKDYLKTGISTKELLEGVAVQKLSTDEADRLRAEINTQTEAGKPYALTRDTITQFGNTCSSAMTQALNNSGVIPSAALPASVAGFNTVTPSALLEAAADRNEALKAKGRFDPSDYTPQRSDRRLEETAKLLAPLRRLADLDKRLGPVFGELLKNVTESVGKSQRLDAAKTFVDSSSKSSLRPEDVQSIAGALYRAVDVNGGESDTSALNEAVTNAVRSVVSPTQVGVNTRDTNLAIAETLGSLVAGGSGVRAETSTAYDSVIGSAEESLGTALKGYADRLTSLSPAIGKAVSPLIKSLDEMVKAQEWTKLRSALDALSDRIFALNVASVVAEGRALEGAGSEAAATGEADISATRADLSSALSALKTQRTGIAPFDEASKAFGAGLNFLSELGSIKNGLFAFINALRDINPGSLIDMAGALLKIGGASNNIAYNALGGKGNALGLTPHREDRANTVTAFADLALKQAGGGIDYKLLNKQARDTAESNGLGFIFGNKPQISSKVPTESSALSEVMTDLNSRFKGVRTQENLRGQGYVREQLGKKKPIDPTAPEFRGLWRSPKTDAGYEKEAASLTQMYNRVLKETLDNGLKAAETKAQSSGVNAMISGRSAEDPSTAASIRAVLKNLTPDELGRTKNYEEALTKLFDGTGFAKIVQEGGYVVSSASSLIGVMRDVFGDSSDIYKEASKLIGDNGLGVSGLAVPLPDGGGYNGQLGFSVIGAQRTDLSPADTAAHELTHVATKALGPDTISAVDSGSRLAELEADPALRSAMVESSKSISREYSRFIGEVDKDLSYYLDPNEVLANVGQTMLTGNKKLGKVFQNLYGDDLFDRAADILEKSFPDTFGRDARSTIRTRVETFNEQAAPLVSESKASVVDVGAVSRAVQDQVQATAKRLGLISSDPGINAAIGQLTGALTKSLGETGSALDRAISGALSDGTVTSQLQKILLGEFKEVNFSGLVKSAFDAGLGSVLAPGDPNFINDLIQKQFPKQVNDSVTYSAGQQLAARTGSGPDLSREFFDKFNDDFRKRTGEDLSNQGFDVQQTYDFEAGVTRLTASAKTATGATTQLSGEVDRLGRFSVKAGEGTGFLSSIMDNFAREIPNEIVEEFLYSIISGAQQLFTSILNIQDEIAEVGILMEDASGEVKGNTEQMAQSFVAAAIEVAGRTGQGFEEAVKTSIQNFKTLGAVSDPEERTALSQRLSETQLGAQTIFGISLDQSLEALPAIYTQLRDTLTDVDTDAGERADVAITALEGLLDKFVVARRESGAAGEDLITVYAKLASSASDIGLDPDKLLALTASASLALGKSAEETANSLKFFIERIFSQQGIEALRDYGIAVREIGDDGIPRLRGLDEIMDDINSKIAETPQLAKGLAQTLGGKARAGEVSAILGSRNEGARIEGTLATGVVGDEAEKDISRKAEKFSGSINTMKANLGLFLQTAFFSSGVLNELGEALVKLSGYASNLSGYLIDNQDLLDKTKPIITTLGETIVFLALNAGKGVLKLITSIGQISNSIRAGVTSTINLLSQAPDTIQQRTAKATISVINEYQKIISSGGEVAKSTEQMAARMETAIKGLVGDLKGLNTALSSLGGATSLTGAPSGLLGARGSDGVDGTAVKLNTDANVAAMKAEQVERIATTATVAQTRVATTSMGGATRQTTTALQRMSLFLKGFTTTGFTGVSTAIQRSPGLQRGLGVASDVALPALFDVMLGGNNGETWTKVGVSIAGGVLGSFLGPTGTIIGYTIAGAFADGMDVYGMFGNSEKEKTNSVKALASLSPTDTNLLAQFASSTQATQLLKTNANTPLKGLAGDTDPAKTFLGIPAPSNNLKDALGDFDPKLIDIALKSGVSSYQEFYDLIKAANVEGSDLNKKILEQKGLIADSNEELDGGVAYFDSMSGRLDTIQEKLRSVGEISKAAFVTPDLGVLTTYDTFGTQQQALREQFDPKFDAIASGKLTGDDANAALEQYDLGRQSLAGIPELATTLSPIQDILGQTFEDLNQQLYDLGPTGQGAFASMVQPLTEMITYTQEYEAQLEAIRQLKETIALESGAAGTKPEDLVAAQQELANLEQQVGSRSALYAVYTQYLGLVKQSPGLLQGELSSLVKQEKARKATVIPGTAAQFKLPSQVDAEGYSTDEIKQALEDARQKQADLVKMFPQAAKEFSKEQFLLSAGGQFKGVTGVSQSYFQESLGNQRKDRPERLQAPDTVDLSEYDDATVQKILADARNLQGQAVALAPDLGEEFKDDRLLIMQKNNSLLLENGLSQDYLQAAIDANTKATDDNSGELRGHYNLPGNYTPPTVWDYYDQGGTEAGSTNFVPPPGGAGGDMVSLSMAQSIANAILAEGTGASSTDVIPDLGGLGSLITPGSAPLGFPDPGTATRVILPPDLDLPDGITTKNIDVGGVPLSDLLRDKMTPPTPEEEYRTGERELPPTEYGYRRTPERQPSEDLSVPRPLNTPDQLGALPPVYGSMNSSGGVWDELDATASEMDSAAKVAGKAAVRAGSSHESVARTSDQVAVSMKQLQGDAGIASTGLGGVGRGAGVLSATLGQFGLGASQFSGAVTTLVNQLRGVNFARIMADAVTSGQVKITIDSQNQARAEVIGGAGQGAGVSTGRGSSSLTGTPGSGGQNRV